MFYKANVLKRNRSWQYFKYGALLGIGSPIGWAIIDTVFQLDTHHPVLFYYLVFVTTLSFAIFGTFLGRKIDQVESLSRTDQLSGLYNQATFIEWGTKLHDHCKRSGQNCTVVLLDIDWFKKVNDEYSHLFGNKVIKDIADVILKEARNSDISARFGGDEFSLCLPNTTGTQAVTLIERIRKGVLDLRYSGPEKAARLSVSIGLADLSDQSTEFNTLLKRADEALYQTKESGRNGFTLWKQKT